MAPFSDGFLVGLSKTLKPPINMSTHIQYTVLYVDSTVKATINYCFHISSTVKCFHKMSFHTAHTCQSKTKERE